MASILIHVNTTGERRNPIGSIASLDMLIAVGFGSAVVTRNGKIVVDGEAATPRKLRDPNGFISLRSVEKMVRRDPRGTWRVEINGPLWSASWERKRPGKWECVDSGKGFA
jgi:hypothetical protein